MRSKMKRRRMRGYDIGESNGERRKRKELNRMHGRRWYNKNITI